MKTETLLIELLTEELPPKNLQALSNAFADSLVASLAAAGLMAEGAAVVRYATPRRLGVKIGAVAAMQVDRMVEKKGPAVAAAYDAAGQPTKALMGFAAGAGVDINTLEKVMDGKREVVLAKSLHKGQSLAALLPAMLDAAIKALPVAKAMRWADLSESFVRPVHHITLLHGADVVPYQRFGIHADRLTDGHRFLGKKNIVIPHADDYERLMTQEGAVVVDFAARRALIVAALDAAAARQGQAGDRCYAPEALVDEVTALTENPTVIEGAFDPAFLQVPQEALMVSMTQHQKYFPVLNAEGKITARFLLVANMPLAASSPETIRHGNERVLRARLSDAQFFYDTDRKHPLADSMEALKKVTHLQALAGQNGQGSSLFDRVQRVAKLAEKIAPVLAVEPDAVRRAAALCKVDLLTGLVGEFPELQGIAGEYYARHDGERADVAAAIREHYAPRFSGDQLPPSKLGQCLALADKLEAIACMFGINRPPTGDKDPFALRRAALGVIRMMVELSLPLNLSDILADLPALFVGTAWRAEHEGGHTLTLMQNFMHDRLRQYLRDGGHEVSRVDAVLAHATSRYDDVLARLAALAAFVEQPQAATLIAMGKRIRNLLRQSQEKDGALVPVALADVLWQAPEEIALYQAWLSVSHNVAHGKQGDFLPALMGLLAIEQPLSNFFEQVMVMCDDRTLRQARLGLLRELDIGMNGVGDLSALRA